jgi:hypothetical protein
MNSPVFAVLSFLIAASNTPVPPGDTSRFTTMGAKVKSI